MANFLGRLAASDLTDKKSAQMQLGSWNPSKEFLACFDVDGHLLDNMTAKQVIVFQPHFMDVFGLRGIESYYRLHAEFHNLWSTDRGCDRHEAQSLTLGSLLKDPELKGEVTIQDAGKIEGIKLSIDGYLKRMRSTGGAYGFDSLFAHQQENPHDPNLTQLLIWSKAVDLTFPFVTIPMEPFPRVRETLAFVSDRADVLIVSKTPYEDICNWLEHHDLIEFVTAVAGKEQGGKDEHICLAMGGEYDAKTKEVVHAGAKYQPSKVIMGGDGEGDLKAVKKNGGFFFPTPPAQEESAWIAAIDEVFRPFFDGAYVEGERRRIDGFRQAMQTKGPWEEPDYRHLRAFEVLQKKRTQLYRQLEPGGKLFSVAKQPNARQQR